MPSHAPLPPDQYGVLVENEVDELKLRWLVDNVGENSLRAAVSLLAARYPGRQPFVSTVLKRMHVRVPVKVYRAVCVPVYWLYFLTLHDLSKVKIGMSGRWAQRACSFVPLQSKLLEVFDPDFSFALLVGPDKKEALRRETLAKRYFESQRVEAPWRDGTTAYGAMGHKEWFDGEILPRIFNFVADFRTDWSQTAIRSLRQAILEDVEDFPQVCTKPQ